MVPLPNMVGSQTHLTASPHSFTRVRTCTCTCTAASRCPPRRREFRAARPTGHPSGSRHNRTHRARLRVVRQLSCRTSRCPTSSVSPPAHELPSTARPRLAMLDSSCGLTAAHREHAVRQLTELFRALYGALTDFLLFPAPRYGRARAWASIGRRGEYGRWLRRASDESLLIFGVVYNVLWFFLVLYVEPTCGVLSATVNQAPRSGSSVRDKHFIRFV